MYYRPKMSMMPATNNILQQLNRFRLPPNAFSRGVINSVDFLYEKTNLINAESKLLQARYNLIFNYKVLDFYQGKPLEL